MDKEEYEITIQTKTEKELLNSLKDVIDGFPDDLDWNGVYILYGTIGGAIHRHQGLPKESKELT